MASSTRLNEAPNGCGCASGWLKWLKPPYHNYFHDDCVYHDALYNKGGTEKDRKFADRKLFRRMVKRALGLNPWKATWRTIIALSYYVTVRMFGRKYYNYNTSCL